jgi:hypothetical protein
VAIVVSMVTPPPPAYIGELVERIRLPRAAFGEEDSGPSAH